MKVYVGGRPWRSFEAARRSAMVLFDDFEFRTVPLYGAAYDLVRDMLDLHPHCEWFLEDGAVRRLKVEREHDRDVIAVYSGAKEKRHWFSLAQCRLTPLTERTRLVRLLRQAVSDQVSAFKNAELDRTAEHSPYYCKICGDPIDPISDVHVHHDNDPFAAISDRFISSEGAPDLDQPVDADWITQWQDFHRDNATLALVHRSCHMLLGSVDVGSREEVNHHV